MLKYILFYSTLMLFFSSACSKKKNDPAPANFKGCRIAKVVDDYGDGINNFTHEFTYNDDGSVAKITSHESNLVVRSFSYKKNSIIVTITSDGAQSSKDSIQLDDQNRVIFINHLDAGGSIYNPDWESFEYDSLGNMVLYTVNYYNTMSTGNYYWKNGDLQWSSSGNRVYYYKYRSELYNTGNIPARLTDFTRYGRAIYTSRHFPESAFSTVDTVKYNFELDNEGKVLSCRRPDLIGMDVTSKVTYSCK